MERRCLARQVDNATNCRNILREPVRERTFNSDIRECLTCGQTLANRNGRMDWFELPAGVRFDPSDEELLVHLAAKLGKDGSKSHPLIDDFIPVLEGEDGICQTHPEKLPGVKDDGSSRHFFHRPAMAYTTGTRKRRKIHSEDDELGVETRWHKTGVTRAVMVNGAVLGWKKIMVLYRNTGKNKSKSEKTNWVLHQYHLGANEEEKDGELVVCKVFYQKKPRQSAAGVKLSEISNEAHPEVSREVSLTGVSEESRGTPVTPQTDAPVRPRNMKHVTKDIPPVAQPLGDGTFPTISRSSDLSVNGNTSVPAYYANNSMAMGLRTTSNAGSGGCLQSNFLENQFLPVQEEYINDCDTIHEEVSTSAKLWRNEAEGLSHNSSFLKDHNPEDVYYQNYAYIGESQQPEDCSDFLFMPDLRCEEELCGDPFYEDATRADVDMRSCAYAVGCSLDEQVIGDIVPGFPALDEILLDTPPALMEELVVSAQEAMDWIGKKQSDYDPLDNTDSLSST